MIRTSDITNPNLLAMLARLRHTERLVIADPGLPASPAVPEIDLSLTAGVPTLHQVLEVVLAALAVEAITLAEEARGTATEASLARLAPELPPAYVPHAELKAITNQSQAVIRTGECTPYANVVLTCGVTF